MKYEIFAEIVALIKEQSDKEQASYDVGVDLINFNDPIHAAISHLIGAIYGTDGKDVFDWWCYEKEWGARKDLTMQEADGTEVCQTLVDLHEWLEKNKTDDYGLPIKLSLEERLSLITSIFGGTGGSA
jgi:hypothetical protein